MNSRTDLILKLIAAAASAAVLAICNAIEEKSQKEGSKRCRLTDDDT